MKNIQIHLNGSKNRKSIMKEAADIYENLKNKTEAVSKLNIFAQNRKYKEPEVVRLFCATFDYTVRYFKYPENQNKKYTLFVT